MDLAGKVYEANAKANENASNNASDDSSDAQEAEYKEK